ncbi:hypothetical protein FOL47_004463 [Perkinsus chesapeaki]|uniref:DUF2817 domain-containing protein n=1 Tax=Perkinsus chesapeaki TaxID=330153 RepID=A0A7J6M2A8_PERCH|nr:hypothetical protein FOL47_004463 [Perkinsus chesapeaki]
MRYLKHACGAIAAAALAVLIAFFSLVAELTWKPWFRYPPLCDVRSGGGDIIDRPECFFSEDYYQARSKFRRLALAAGFEVKSFEVVPPSQHGDVYMMDVAVRKPAGATISGRVVHTSGIHGVEGFAGSGIQCSILSHIASKKLDTNKTLIFVHAANPFGMVHLRRFNEENVDLNRNALTPQEFNYLINERDPNIAGYNDLDPVLNPEDTSITSLLYNSVLIILKYGMSHIKRAVVSAQYLKPAGIFYGGQNLQRTYEIMNEAIVLTDLGVFEGGNATMIDIHTGLGPSGVDTLLTADSEDFDYFAALQSSLGHLEESPVECVGIGCTGGGPKNPNEPEFAADVAKGYDLTQGDAGTFWKKKSNRHAKVRHVSQEFGTLNIMLALPVMIIENAAFQKATEDHSRWAKYNSDYFYVRTPEWTRSLAER